MTPPTETKALPRGEEVDRGSVTDLDDGETFVLRRAEAHGAGIPTVDHGGADAGVEATARINRSFIAALRGYLELRQTPYGLGPALLIGSLGFFGVFQSGAFGTAAPFIVRDLGISIGSLIQIESYVSVVSIFLTLLAGYYLDRHNRVPWLGVGAIVSGAASMFSSGAWSLATLSFPQVIQAAGDDFGGVPRFSLLTDYYPPESRGRVFAMLGTFTSIGSFGAIFLTGPVIDHYGWRVSLYVFSVPLIAAGIVALVRLREPVRGYMERLAMGADDDAARQEDEPQSFGEAVRSTWAILTLRRVMLAQFFGLAGSGVFGLFLPFFLVDRYHLSATELSLVGLPGLTAVTIGGIYGGNMIDFFTRRNPGRVLIFLGALGLINALGTVAYIFTPPLWILLIASFVLSIGSGLLGPATTVVYAQVIPPNIRTQGIQITSLAALPAIMIFVPLGRQIFDRSGYSNVFLFCLPLLIIGAILQMTASTFFDTDVRRAFASAAAAQEWLRARKRGGGKLLVCRDVDGAYNGVQVLFNVDFDVEDGEIIALLGTNGAGKSTLLRAISGATEASGGAIVFDGREITHMPPHEVASRGVISMPGGRGVFPGLSVRENLMLANWMTDDPEEVRRGLTEVFEIFPALKERADVVAGSLSGGEQQQLSLAQAFLGRPRLLMIDELSLGLAPAVVAELLDVVREIHKRGVTIVIVEQSVNVALTIAEKAIFMEKGEVRFFGRTADLLARPDILRSVYVKGTGALMDGPPTSERQRRERELATTRDILEVENIVKSYGGIRAVDEVTFALREGEVLGLIGPNGAGKTTIFDMVSGFTPMDSGTVRFEGIDITNLAPEERATRGMVRRFQDARLFSSLTVYETLLVALEKRLEVKSSILNAAAMPQARRAERRLRIRADQLIELLELGSYRDKFVKELSTGLRRIVDLACVLAAQPKVLLLDEPSSGIAQAEAESLAPLLRRVRFESGCSILIIEHDMTLISSVSDELLALERGHTVVRGAPEVVLNDERVIESYLGTSEETIARSGRK